MIRITEQMGLATAQNDMARIYNQLAIHQQRATSGSRINQAADDPAGAARVANMDSQLQSIEQCQSNLARAFGELDAADKALDTVTNLLIRAREIGLSMANGTVTGQERAVAAEEVQDLKDEIISLANTKHDGVYIFGGYQTDTAPLDSSGAFVGDGNVRRILALPEQAVNVSVSAEEAFTAAGGTDIIADLEALRAALAADDISAISSGSTALEAAQGQVISVRARAGVMTARLFRMDTYLSDRTIQLQSDRSRVADSDAVETLSELAQAQRSLNAALQVSASMLSKLSLVDKL